MQETADTVVETLSTFSLEKFYPNVTHWAKKHGTMNDAMKALESGIAEWIKENES